ncbi:MAG: glycosyltransferase family 1 protein [Patescibacteria group bacterium]
MIIGIDGNEANVKNRVGVNQYGFELLWGIRKLQDEWKNKHKVIVFLKERPLDDLPKESEFFKYKVLLGKGMWIVKKLTPYLLFSKEKVDIFFSPSHYVPLLSTMPRVCSIMDLGFLNFTTQFKKLVLWQLRLWSAYSIIVSKSIIAISNSTKEDIVRHFPFASKKVNVTHLAYDSDKYKVDVSEKDVRRIKEKHTIVGDYILFLSTLKPSKNIESLIDAFRLVKTKYPEIKLVIAGKKGWMYESIFKKVEKLGLKKNVIFTDFVDEDEKPGLFKGAKVFVLPSFWEGFGLDVLNSLASGTPVVVSNAGSLPEVVEEAGILINPNDTNTLYEGIVKVLSMNDLEYNKVVEKGLAQVKKFSWEKTARETLKILEETR